MKMIRRDEYASSLLTEYDRYAARQRFYRNPWKWVVKWTAGIIVYLLYVALRLLLYSWYNYVFLPWRDR
jgi:hypothetical protein